MPQFIYFHTYSCYFECTLTSMFTLCVLTCQCVHSSMATCCALWVSGWCTQNNQNVECLTPHFSLSMITILATKQMERDHQSTANIYVHKQGKLKNALIFKRWTKNASRYFWLVMQHLQLLTSFLSESTVWGNTTLSKFMHYTHLSTCTVYYIEVY